MNWTKRKVVATSWDAGDVLTNRLMIYHSAPTIFGKDSGAERFRFILMSIGSAKQPVNRYGPVSLDLQATLESMGVIQAFASTMPEGFADTLRNIIGEYGLALG